MIPDAIYYMFDIHEPEKGEDESHTRLPKKHSTLCRCACTIFPFIIYSYRSELLRENDLQRKLIL